MKDTESYVNKAEVKRKIRVWLDYRTSRQVTDGLLDLIEKLPVTVKSQLETTLESNWVSVKDRLPEKSIPVLICATGHRVTAYYDKVKEIFRLTEDENMYYLTDCVTHWMPLPTPPESESDAE